MKEAVVDAAHRHIAEGERRIAALLVAIEGLRSIGASICLAEQLLIELEISQSLFLSDLERLQNQEAGKGAAQFSDPR